MNYFLYQLEFNTAVHFGGSDSALSLYQSEDHFRADTLFSALCHTALQLDGESGLNRLLELARKGELLPIRCRFVLCLLYRRYFVKFSSDLPIGFRF